MEWYRIHSLKHGTVDVSAENWLAALGIGLGHMGMVQNLTRIACETLPNGRILVRDVQTGLGYAVDRIAGENAVEDEPTSERDLATIPEEAIQASVGLDDYAADIRSAPSTEEAIRRTFAAVLEVAPAEAGAVLRRHADHWLGFEGAFGPMAERLSGLVIPPGTGVAGFTVGRAIAVTLRDAYADPRFFRQIDAYTGYTTRSLATIPLLANGVVHGCLELINAPSSTGFSREEVADADILASALAERLAAEPVPAPPSRA